MTFFSHKKIGATLYQSKPVISSTPSLNVDRNCRFFIQPVGRASSLSCKTMMSLFPRAGWNWRLQRGLQVDLLGGGAPLGLPDHIPAAPPQCPPRNHLDKEPSQQWGRGWEGRELSKCDIWPRMVIILTDFWIFTKNYQLVTFFHTKTGAICHWILTKIGELFTPPPPTLQRRVFQGALDSIFCQITTVSDTVKRMGWTKSLIGSCMSWIFLFLIVGNDVQIGHKQSENSHVQGRWHICGWTRNFPQNTVGLFAGFRINILKWKVFWASETCWTRFMIHLVELIIENVTKIGEQ